MKLYREDVIRKQADTPTLKMLDLWHKLCNEKLDTTIEIMVGNRREHPELNSYQGELHTALPQVYKDKYILALWLDSLDSVSSIIVTHEIGHWVLKLQGVKGVRNGSDPNSDTEILLNTMSQHPALYSLQRSIGHEPQKEIDKRTAQRLAILSKTTETVDEKTHLENAFTISDDLINCSQNNRTGMFRILSRKYPKTEKIVNKIFEVKDRRDISKIEDILPFCQDIIQKLNLGNNWYVVDDLNTLRTKLMKLGE